MQKFVENHQFNIILSYFKQFLDDYVLKKTSMNWQKY